MRAPLPPSAKGKERDELAERLVAFALSAIVRINKFFAVLISGMAVVLMPQLSSYQMRVYILMLMQVLSTEFCCLFVAKLLQVYYFINNQLLLVSVAALPPFLIVVYQLWWFIPCPPLVSAISNAALLAALITLAVLGWGNYKDYSTTYAHVMTVWPWLILASMISRLHIQVASGKNPFLPVREQPFLGILSALTQVGMFMAVKQITLTDCIVLAGLDHVVAALFASSWLGSERRKLHFFNLKVYLLIIAVVAIYLFGEQGPGHLQISSPTQYHLLFLACRVGQAFRSIFVKWRYIGFNKGFPTKMPEESGLLFYGAVRPRKHRFQDFPGPMLLLLDALFDSGLKDMEMHGMGPLGTQDLYMLTESTYLLPVAAFFAFFFERQTLSYGLFPLYYSTTSTTAADYAQQQMVYIQALNTGASGSMLPGASGSMPPTIKENVTSTDFLVIAICLIVYILSRLAVPTMTATSIFDPASPWSSWRFQPILVAIPFFLLDVGFLNGKISKFQLLCVIALGCIVGIHRSDLANKFRRKYLLICTQELHYFRPSALRPLQRRTLLDFLKTTSTEDYLSALLETSIRHGANIRELARSTGITVWDPSPAATASWKLAFSLVTKSLRRQKLLRRKQLDSMGEMRNVIQKMVVDIVYRAVDEALGHGLRLKLAGTLAVTMAKRRAIRRIRDLARSRRMLRQKRRNGQLASEGMALTTACGVLRSIKDFPAAPPRSMANTMTSIASMLGSREGNLKALQHMSLTATSFGHATELDSVASPTRASIPGELDLERGAERMEATLTRGVWGITDGRDPRGSLVLAFGDGRRGQLGMEPTAAARQIARSMVTTIEELRGHEPCQIIAAGVSSFVVGTGGQIWAFGSNRSMELGFRKEITQIIAPQRLKSVRAAKAVQVACSCSASGQSHTLVLSANGEVTTFGSSSCGAMGQGVEVKQTPPLLLRMSTQVRIRLVASGARHSLLLADNGQLYSCGDNRQGQLGLGITDQSVHEPMLLKSTDRYTMLATGDDHSMALAKTGKLYAWGANANGQLGLGRIDPQASPTHIARLPATLGITGFACGSRHSLVVTGGGKQVWAFGSNVYGQLGIGQQSDSDGSQLSLPILVQALSNSSREDRYVVQVAAAASHSLALTVSGEVFGFGDNSFGQIGFPMVQGNNAPLTSIQALVKEHEVKKKLGAPPSLVRKAMEIDAPQTFANGVERLFVPTKVASLSLYQIRAISTGDMHSLALAA